MPHTDTEQVIQEFGTAQDPKVVVVLTPQQTADWLNCSREHVYRLIKHGSLKAIDIAPRGSMRSKTRIREDDLIAYIAQAQASEALR